MNSISKVKIRSVIKKTAILLGISTALCINQAIAASIPDRATKRALVSVSDDSQLASGVLLQALQFMDVKYKYGGVSPTGFDCSGFVQYIFKTVSGANLPRTSAEQARFGIAVKKDDLQVGDIVFFNTIGKIKNSHNGIYIGNNKFIHAPRTGKRIHIADMSKDYWVKRYSTARRVTVNYINNQSSPDLLKTVHQIRSTMPAAKIKNFRVKQDQRENQQKDVIAELIRSLS